ncbi:MAG: type II toxin-antitoxin system HicB family antitoxin [Candidatus Omnitrophota bacterium]
MRIKIVLEKGEDGYIVASVPSLPGCHSQGKSEKEVLKNIKEAVLLYLEPNPKDIRSDSTHKVLSLTI